MASNVRNHEFPRALQRPQLSGFRVFRAKVFRVFRVHLDSTTWRKLKPHGASAAPLSGIVEAEVVVERRLSVLNVRSARARTL